MTPDHPSRIEAPAGFVQEPHWHAHLRSPSSVSDTMGFAIRLIGDLDLNHMQQAVDALVERHEVLRTHLEDRNGNLTQIISSHADAAITTASACCGSPGARIAEAKDIILSYAARPFQLYNPPLFRTLLVRLAVDETDNILAFILHHTICDWWSLRLLGDELLAIYEALENNREPSLPVPSNYRDYTSWQRGWRTNARLQRELAHWRRRLHGAAPRLDLFPLISPREQIQHERFDTVPISISKSSWSTAVDIARTVRASDSALIVTAFCIALKDYSAVDELTIGMLLTDRPQAWMMSIVGHLLNDVTLRVDYHDDPTVRMLVRRVSQIQWDAISNGHFPFIELQRLLAAGRPNGRTFWEAWVNIIRTGGDNPDRGHSVEPQPPSLLVSDLPIDWGLLRGTISEEWDGMVVRLTAVLPRREDSLGLTGQLEFNPEVVRKETMLELRAMIIRVLSELPKVVDRRLSTL